MLIRMTTIALMTFLAGGQAYAQDPVESMVVAPLAPATTTALAALQQQSGTRREAESALRGVTFEAIAISLAFLAVAVGITSGDRDRDDIIVEPPVTPPVHHSPSHN